MPIIVIALLSILVSLIALVVRGSIAPLFLQVLCFSGHISSPVDQDHKTVCDARIGVDIHLQFVLFTGHSVTLCIYHDR